MPAPVHGSQHHSARSTAAASASPMLHFSRADLALIGGPSALAKVNAFLGRQAKLAHDKGSISTAEIKTELRALDGVPEPLQACLAKQVLVGPRHAQLSEGAFNHLREVARTLLSASDWDRSGTELSATSFRGVDSYEPQKKPSSLHEDLKLALADLASHTPEAVAETDRRQQKFVDYLRAHPRNGGGGWAGGHFVADGWDHNGGALSTSTMGGDEHFGPGSYGVNTNDGGPDLFSAWSSGVDAAWNAATDGGTFGAGDGGGDGGGE